MRVSNQITYNTVQYNIQRAMSRLYSAQEMMATQKRINRISDDPIGASQLLETKVSLRKTEQFERNLNSAQSLTELYDTTLGEVVELISRGKELLLSQANDIASSPATREAARVEMVSLIGGVLTAANARHGVRYIFAGFNDDSPPFAGASVAVTDDGNRETAGANTGTGVVDASSVFDTIQLTSDDYVIEFTGAATYDIYNATQGVYESTGNTYVAGDEIRFNGISVTLSGAPDGPTGAPATIGDTFRITNTT